MKKDKTVLIIGVNGQDGSYLAEYLSKENWKIIGIGRQLSCRPDTLCYLSKYYSVDIANIVDLQICLSNERPDLIFHTAAIHGAAGFDYEKYWLSAHQVNVISLHAILEYIRLENPSTKIIYFSSAKVFGILDGKTIDEYSDRFSNCIYTITKNSAESLISYYRKMHNINIALIWLFNHESARRAPNYFVMKVATALKSSLINTNYKILIDSLDFWCDWGSAREYMELLSRSIHLLRNENYILASGKTVWARDVVSEFFERRGLSLVNHITVRNNSENHRQKCWTASNSLIKSVTGRTPSLYGIEVFEEVFSDL